MRDGDISSHAESPGHCWYPGRAGCGARGCSGSCNEPHKGGHNSSRTLQSPGQTYGLSSSWRTSQQEADALPGPDPSCRQPHACPWGRSNRQPVLSLSGLPASRRLELKNLIFPFSGASAPARGQERSREAPTLPAAKDALTGQHSGAEEKAGVM